MKVVLLLIIIFMTTITNAKKYICEDWIDDKWKDSRYINNNGTIIDNNTGLMWKRCVEGQTWDNKNDTCIGHQLKMNWKDALSLNGSIFAKHNDWRVPNINELMSLTTYNCKHPSINKNMFLSAYLPYIVTWSSTPYFFNDKQSWSFRFDYGYDVATNRNYDGMVRLVRLGQQLSVY